MIPQPPPQADLDAAPPRAPTARELRALVVLARQAIGEGIKSGREIGATYPMLRAVETAEEYARYCEKQESREKENAPDQSLTRKVPPITGVPRPAFIRPLRGAPDTSTSEKEEA